MARRCGTEPLTRDPLYQDEQRLDRLAADERMAPAIMRLRWLKLASGLLALAIVRGDLAGLALAGMN